MTTIPTRPVAEPPAVLARARALVDEPIRAAVARLNPELRAPLEHHLAGGGKHVRAALALLSAAASGADEEEAIPAAVAIELMHNFSLIHDDVIDGDRERRHRATVWAEFGVGAAIIAGDALALLATEVLLDGAGPFGSVAALALAKATQGMISGQADDMAFETRSVVSIDECLTMEERKTGALLACAASLGAVLAGAPTAVTDALAQFGNHLGVAFQAVDDLLGIWGDPRVTGKPVGSDLRQHKKTLPVCAALAAADGMAGELVTLLRGRLSERDVETAAQFVDAYGGRDITLATADRHLGLALAALDRVPLAAGPSAELAELARFVVGRDR